MEVFQKCQRVLYSSKAFLLSVSSYNCRLFNCTVYFRHTHTSSCLRRSSSLSWRVYSWHWYWSKHFLWYSTCSSTHLLHNLL